MPLNAFNQTITIAGSVIAVDEAKPSFSLRARSGDVFEAVVGSETYYNVMTNLDGLDRNRVPEARGGPGESGILLNLRRYAVVGRPVFVVGIYQQSGGAERFEARSVYLLHSDADRYMFSIWRSPVRYSK